MSLKKEIRRIIIVSLTIATLFCTAYSKAYAAWQPGVMTLKNSRRDLADSQKKEEKEYAKWNIKKVNGVYYYKNKRIRIFIDSEKKTALDTLCYDKSGKVDLEVIRNKNHSIKKIKFLSKKKAKKIIKNLNMAYVSI